MVSLQKYRNFARDVLTPYSIRHLGIAFAPQTRFLFSQRGLILKRLKVDCVIDVGANIGQFAKEMRRTGYKGRLVSVEPLNEPYLQLKRNFRKDKLWTGKQFLIGEECRLARIEQWGDSSTSSVLEVSEEVLLTHSYLRSRGSEEHQMKTLECFLNSDFDLEEFSNIFVKIDVQGYEDQVLFTLPLISHLISVIQLEASLLDIYTGGSKLDSTFNLLNSAGYTVVTVMTERFHKENLCALDTDLIAVRNDLLHNLRKAVPDSKT